MKIGPMTVFVDNLALCAEFFIAIMYIELVEKLDARPIIERSVLLPVSQEFFCVCGESLTFF